MEVGLGYMVHLLPTTTAEHRILGFVGAVDALGKEGGTRLIILRLRALGVCNYIEKQQWITKTKMPKTSSSCFRIICFNIGKQKADYSIA